MGWKGERQIVVEGGEVDGGGRGKDRWGRGDR